MTTPAPIDHRALAAKFRNGIGFTAIHKGPEVAAAQAALATAHEAAAIADMLAEFLEHARKALTPIRLEVPAALAASAAADSLTALVDATQEAREPIPVPVALARVVNIPMRDDARDLRPEAERGQR